MRYLNHLYCMHVNEKLMRIAPFHLSFRLEFRTFMDIDSF